MAAAVDEGRKVKVRIGAGQRKDKSALELATAPITIDKDSAMQIVHACCIFSGLQTRLDLVTGLDLLVIGGRGVKARWRAISQEKLAKTHVPLRPTCKDKAYFELAIAALPVVGCV